MKDRFNLDSGMLVEGPPSERLTAILTSIKEDESWMGSTYHESPYGPCGAQGSGGDRYRFERIDDDLSDLEGRFNAWKVRLNAPAPGS